MMIFFPDNKRCEYESEQEDIYEVNLEVGEDAF